jgi:hypothetical protein
LLFDKGYTYAQIAGVLFLDDETVRRQVNEYWESKKISNNYKGNQEKLTKFQSQELITYL